MNAREIIGCVDSGANFYLGFFGDAKHMEYRDEGFYSFVRPKPGERGVSFAFDVRLERLPENEQIRLIGEIKALKMPVWWSLQTSGPLFRLIHGRDKAPLTSRPGDELYMAMLPGEQVDVSYPEYEAVKQAGTKEEFALWAGLVNGVLSGGYPDVHPEHHYHRCEEGTLSCYVLYRDGRAAAAASVMDRRGVCSLEFVATLPEYRRKGLARAVCAAAVKNAFEKNAKIVTLRAVNPGTRELYESLGFRLYNDAV